jgi:Ca-activated chloride channel family protein
VAVLFPVMQVEKEAVRKSLAAAAPAKQPMGFTLAAESVVVQPPPLDSQPIFPAATPRAPQLATITTANADSAPLIVMTGPAMALPAKSALPESAPLSPGAQIASGVGRKSKEQLAQLSTEAEGFYQTGRFDMAKKRAEQILAADPYNLDARKLNDKVDRQARDYGIAAYNETRTNANRQVDLAWQRPIRRFADAAPASRAAGAGSAGLDKATVGNIDEVVPNESTRSFPITPTTPTAFDAGVSDPGTSESFAAITDNAFLPAHENPLSTFSIDVDTASYAIVRRFLNRQQLPPKGAVRIEELLNYFTYDYPQPQGDAPFSATMEVAACPWTPEHRLVRIGLKGREIAKDQRPASNLVFLIDVSGSMQPENKLPLLKQSLALLIDQLGAEDQVAIAVYAGSSGCVLEPTHDKREMRAALQKLEAGGSTNGGSGLQLAYRLAEKSFIKGGTNRVILATDGDWNVGITKQDDLLNLIKRKAKSGVFLTVLGVGMDNLKDTMLVKLADSGNGNYAYLDTLLEAKKVLVDQLSGTLVTIAKDVKIQIEFNPAQVGAYRLIGYEKRILAKEDFNDDKKDAGEIGAGHTVTALYEVVPVGQQLVALQKPVDPLKYQPSLSKPVPVTEPAAPAATPAPVSNELLTLKLRYKEPEGDTSKLVEFPLTDRGTDWAKSSRDFRFAAAVAGYGMLLRDSPYKGEATWSAVREWAQEGKGADASGYRTEFLALLEKAKALTQ